MASQLVREWTGIQQFPVATQTALHGLLGKLKQENVETLTILVLGKSGVGKSSTVNSLVGERVAAVSAFQSEAMQPIICSRTRGAFTLNVIDTPGLVEGGFVNDHALDLIKRFLINKTIDVLLYVDRLDGYRVDSLDKQVINTIASCFGQQIWQRGLLVLTHAQLSAPDGISYTEFVEKRSSALQAAVHQAAGFKKSDTQVRVVLVENSGRCNTNESGEKILPDGKVWLPNLVKNIVETVTNGSTSILVDKSLIEGPNANQRGKCWIPLILILQYFFLVKPIRRAIQRDVERENTQRPEWEIRDEMIRPASRPVVRRR